MLTSKRGLCGLYDKIIIFSPTFKSQFKQLWSQISPVGVTVHEELKEEILEQIYQEQLESSIKKRILMISDDVGESWRRDISSGLCNRIMTNGRHVAISCIFLLQKIHQVPVVCRSQMDTLCVWAASSFNQLDSIHKEFSTLNRKEFQKMFADITQQQYHYLVITVIQGKIKFFDSFESEYIIKNE